MSPLDFQERAPSQEIQDLLKMHREQKFDMEEPYPWSWKVWTRVQREKNTLKQIISFKNPNGNHFNRCNHNQAISHSHHSHQVEDPGIKQISNQSNYDSSCVLI